MTQAQLMYCLYLANLPQNAQTVTGQMLRLLLFCLGQAAGKQPGVTSPPTPQTAAQMTATFANYLTAPGISTTIAQATADGAFLWPAASFPPGLQY